MTPSHQALAEALEWAGPRVVMNDWEKSTQDQHFAVLKEAARAYAELLPRLEELRVAREKSDETYYAAFLKNGDYKSPEYRDHYEADTQYRLLLNAFAQSLGEKK